MERRLTFPTTVRHGASCKWRLVVRACAAANRSDWPVLDRLGLGAELRHNPLDNDQLAAHVVDIAWSTDNASVAVAACKCVCVCVESFAAWPYAPMTELGAARAMVSVLVRHQHHADATADR